MFRQPHKAKRLPLEPHSQFKLAGYNVRRSTLPIHHAISRRDHVTEAFVIAALADVVLLLAVVVVDVVVVFVCWG